MRTIRRQPSRAQAKPSSGIPTAHGMFLCSRYTQGMGLFIASLIGLGALALLFAATSLLISVLGGAQFVRTPPRLYPQLLDLADLTPGELFVEAGCGTGRLLEYVVRNSGAQAHGIELSPLLYLRSLWRARQNPGMSVELRHLAKADYRAADAVYCYLLPGILTKLYAKVARNAKPGAVFISYAFPVPNVKPNQTVPRTEAFAPIYLYRF